MSARTGWIAVGLLLACAPALAKQTKPAKHATAKAAHGATLPAALAGMPEAERLAMQADLAWLGYFGGLSAEEVDNHTLDAIKAFQRRDNGKDTGVLSDPERAALADAAKPRQATVGWRLIDDGATGARVGVPEKLVPRNSAGITGSRWASALGQIQIETFRLHEASLPALFEQEKKTAQRSIAYSALGPDSFVIMGEQRLKKFIVRAQSNGGAANGGAANGGAANASQTSLNEVRGVTVLYDQATEGAMAPIAVAVSDTFAGFPDPAKAPPGRQRGVEYGTATVVSGRGDLLALDDVTDQCQSLTVPGFGHAERIAEDKADNLALLRLYGAHNLVPAALGGSGNTGADLTLFGIAAPLTQPGEGSVTKTTAQLTTQGVTPLPPFGLAGAPAADSQGRFAGLVAPQPPVIAANAAAMPAAMLLPAAAVRAFLDAQGIPSAAAPAPMEQSVVQIICVRQ